MNVFSLFACLSVCVSACMFSDKVEKWQSILLSQVYQNLPPNVKCSMNYWYLISYRNVGFKRKV